MNIYNDSHAAPCKDCPDRWMSEELRTTCHSSCKKFKDFEAFREKKRAEARTRADRLRDLNSIGKYHR